MEAFLGGCRPAPRFVSTLRDIARVGQLLVEHGLPMLTMSLSACDSNQKIRVGVPQASGLGERVQGAMS